ncbi:lysoplasmalogenase family protein [Tenacibaculum sp. MEBiC06402]|uniref:lysoplasmalogenase family protein n=1 Tax=unclassified Tenacibaculum TaxID=2635139 RepID=UPI003B9A91C0
MLKLKNIKRSLFVVYAIICAISVYLIVVNHQYKFEIKPFPTLILIALYLIETKKYNKTHIGFLFLSLIGDIFTSIAYGFNIGIISYGMAYLLLVNSISKYINKETYKLLLIYLLLFGFLFTIVYVFVLNDPGNSMIPILFYGVCICLVTSFILMNYIESMEHANFILLVAIGFRIISDSIYAIVLFSETDVYFDIFSLSTLLISNFLFYRGFLFNEKRVSNFFNRIM